MQPDERKPALFRAYWKHEQRKDKKPLKYLRLVCGLCKVQFWYNYTLVVDQTNPENSLPEKIAFFRAIKVGHRKID